MGFYRFYRLLLLTYPAAFRRDHGHDAAQIFAEACQECLRERRYLMLLSRFARAGVEVPARGLAEHARARPVAHLGQVIAEIPANLRDTSRSLRRTPAFTVTAILTMTIGIALTTAMFTAFNAIAVRGWPGADEDRVVIVRAGAWQGVDISEGFDIEDFRRFNTSQSLVRIAATRNAFQHVATEPRGRAHIVHGQFVTDGFFEAIGVTMARGRTFRPEEDRDGAAHAVVVISHALWHRLFAGAEDVIGRSLYFGDVAYSVIGVTAPLWRGEQPYRDDVWLPLQAIRTLEKDDRLFAAGSTQCCVRLVGRLAQGASREAAAEELSVLSGPRRTTPWRVAVTGTSLFDQLTPSWQAAVSAVLFIATALVLVLTGANITHLQLARAMTRAREIRTRLALGAGRHRIIRQLVTEATTLASAAGVLAIALVYAVLDTLMRVAEMPVIEVWQPDVKVFLYCVVVSLVMSLTFSLLPALRSTRVSLVHGAGTTATPVRLRANLVLLTTQIALSVTLLAGAALLTRALSHATHGNAGFPIEGLTFASIQPGRLGDGARMRTPQFRDALRQALSSSTLPPAAFVDAPPLINPTTTQIQRVGDPSSRAFRAAYAPMSASAFEVFGIPIVEGRPYDDRLNTEAVINQTAARQWWPNESALGKAIRLDQHTYVVTGIARDVYYQSRLQLVPMLHVPSNPVRMAPIVVRAEGPVVESQLRAIIKGLDPDATVTIRSLTGILEDQMGDERAGSQAAWAGGLLALALATFGVFGVFVYVAEERRREIGIRLALGAQRRDVLDTLFRPARLAVGAGLVLGLLSSLAMATMVERSLFGLSPFDPVAFVTVAAIISAAALVATVVPARRALSVDPVVILKAD